jgi:hypothetical protein
MRPAAAHARRAVGIRYMCSQLPGTPHASFACDAPRARCHRDLAPDVNDFLLQESFRQWYPTVRSAKVWHAAPTGAGRRRRGRTARGLGAGPARSLAAVQGRVRWPARSLAASWEWRQRLPRGGDRPIGPSKARCDGPPRLHAPTHSQPRPAGGGAGRMVRPTPRRAPRPPPPPPQVITDPATGRSKGYGFVRFSSEAERDRALEMQVFAAGRHASTGAGRTGREGRQAGWQTVTRALCCTATSCH